jgi:dipeptidyl aminopeptidase/acylaminoacyl peptidase
MKYILTLLLAGAMHLQLAAQVLTPEMLWTLKRVSPSGISNDGTSVLYSSSVYDLSSQTRTSTKYSIPIAGGEAKTVASFDGMLKDSKISPNGKYQILSKEVKIKPVAGTDFYPELDKSNVQIYDNLNYRHWDTWEDGSYGHVFLKDLATGTEIDLMKDEPFDTPLMPFGGDEDFIWNHDGTKVLYVCKKAFGTDYAISTNTDLYAYDIASKTTTNLSQGNMGYDTNPTVSKDGVIAWLQMDVAGNEADKNDIVILSNGVKTNLTAKWDGTVDSYAWSTDGKKIYFIAPFGGAKHLFEVSIPKKGDPAVSQITKGDYDVTSIVGQSGDIMVVTRTDMNHSAEIYTVNLKGGEMKQLTHENDEAYAKIKLSKVEKRMVPTTDGKQMVTWVIYPPDFDPTKKYPTLLYCQGGPQSPLSQFYSVRWNFALMAANGYIIVAPNRRGMPGHGVEWNDQISGDWGGQNIKDYLSAIDHVSKEAYVDKDRLGAVGASYGGYSVFTLAGIHEGRFKSFIAHDGVFNTQSMYGTTEELFFVNNDFGGAYWNTPTPKAYGAFNPINKVANWDTPILIIQGGKDYRVPIGQGLEAFQAAQLQGIKSKLLYFPEENHWILTGQNGIIWQREFFKWLDETLK